ncbi:MAG: hypothetical protein WCD37_13300 [Chloroflexia bacterium]
MNTHDVLAYAIAREVLSQIHGGLPEWALLSTTSYATSSRDWPVPDFVIFDRANRQTVAGEFKPPNQDKREYLTGLGQAIAYTRDFNHSLLVIPEVANDGYHIADHVNEVLAQAVMDPVPLGLLSYDPAIISSTIAPFRLLRPLGTRIGAFAQRATVSDSFWAKWRDISPDELGRFLQYLYDEGRVVGGVGTIRDRAFNRLWNDIQAGTTLHWGGERRNTANTPANKVAWGKNYRNFVDHIGWCLADGRLTPEGLQAMHIAHLYGANSRPFLDNLALAVLLGGKHLVLINTINEYQDNRTRTRGAFPSEQVWLDEVEDYLEAVGYLKRNPGRHAAAVRLSARQFLKSEKTLWKNLELFVPRGAVGGRAYHPGRGLIFNWARITSLLS